jgi:hypothetical protein
MPMLSGFFTGREALFANRAAARVVTNSIVDVYARWTVAVAAVPEPGSIYLLVLGFAAFGFAASNPSRGRSTTKHGARV